MYVTKLSVVIPVYNEEATILSILDKIREVRLMNDIQKEVIVVNDCSTDQSEQMVLAYQQSNPDFAISVFTHDENKGKGAALRTGISKATGECLIIQDADLEYDPREYDDLLRPVVEGFADVVYGSRFMGAKPHRILFFWHTFGNKFLTMLCNVVTNFNLTDMETCYKLFRTEVVQGMELCESRFGFEPEVTIRLSRIPDLRLYEVGISYYGRTYDEGKKIGAKDGFRAIWCILKYGLFGLFTR